MKNDPGSFLVIGAGITGLMIARQLHDAGRTVGVLEKGRGFGGRMATRRDGGARFDHGAQYFTVRDERFQPWVQGWLQAGVIREWFQRFPEDSGSDEHPRYVGIRGMSDIGKHLAAGLEVKCSTRVTDVRRSGDEWRVRDDDGGLHTATYLIITAPVPQALDLLEESDVALPAEAIEALKRVRFEKGLAVMAHLDGPSGLPGFGGVRSTAPPLTWLADNLEKGISEKPAVTLHADGAFAEKHWDSSDEVRGPLLIEAARGHLQAKVVSFRCHRWGFAKPVQTYGAPFFYDAERRLLLAGDGFGGPRVEGAALSAVEAGGFLLNRQRLTAK